MIGGTDIVIPAIGDPATLEACAGIVERYWPDARFEDAATGERYAHCTDIPFATVTELFAYPNEGAEAAWDADRPDSPPNSMLYLILSRDNITVVLDDPNTPDLQAILESIRNVTGERKWSPNLQKH